MLSKKNKTFLEVNVVKNNIKINYIYQKNNRAYPHYTNNYKNRITKSSFLEFSNKNKQLYKVIIETVKFVNY